MRSASVGGRGRGGGSMMSPLLRNDGKPRKPAWTSADFPPQSREGMFTWWRQSGKSVSSPGSESCVGFRDCLKHQGGVGLVLTRFDRGGLQRRELRRREAADGHGIMEELERAGLQRDRGRGQSVRGQRSSAGKGGEGPERSIILFIIIVTLIVNVPLPLLSFGRSRVLV